MNLELLKDLPGFQGVFKAIINSQMKLLIEQLSTHGATETIILTVNLSDGTLSQLGSKTAKGFLEGQDEMKVKFLSHCLNKAVSSKEQSDLQTDLPWIKTEPAIDDSVTVQSENTGLPGAGEKTFPNILTESVVKDTDFGVKLSSQDISAVPAQYSGVFKDQPKSKPLGKKGKFECVKCGKSFKTHQNLQVHDRIHLGIRPFRCDVCDRRFYQSSHLSTHKLKHSGLKRFSCTFCPLKFYTRSNLRSHERTHTGEKPYKCKHCGTAFTHKASVSSHIWWHHQELFKDIDFEKRGSVPKGSDLDRSEPFGTLPRSSRPLPLFLTNCDSANEQTETETDLSEPAGLLPLFSRNIDATTEHTETELYNSVKKERTSISSQDQTSVQFHEPLGLEDNSGFEAGQSSQQSNMLADHLHVVVKDEHVKDEPQLDADTAFHEESGKAYSNGALGKIYSADLTRNDNLDKTGDTGTGSGGFDSGHFQVSELYVDVQNTQARTSKCKKRKRPDRKFECTKCGKSFKSQQNLQVHDRIHSGIRPFSCDICGQGFSQRIHLQTHVRNHTGERPYACTLCPQKFTSSSNLRLHEKRHTEQKQYCCSFCGKKYTKSSSLSSHLKHIHKFSI